MTEDERRQRLRAIIEVVSQPATPDGLARFRAALAGLDGAGRLEFLLRLSTAIDKVDRALGPGEE